MLLRKINENTKIIDVFDLFIEITKVIDEEITIQDLFEILHCRFKINNFTLEKYLTLSEIEPYLFVEKFNKVFDQLFQMQFST